MSLSPAIAALSGYVIRGQRLSPAQWIGVVLVMVASATAVAGAEPPDAVAADAAPLPGRQPAPVLSAER
jgi:inner membrane transporter RhtA